MTSVIFCAAGSGARTGFSENKILHELNGMPVLCHSLSVFSPFADEILIACREEDESAISPLLGGYGARTVRGGKTRAESVYNALQVARGDVVLIHDAARPFVTPETVKRVLKSVREKGSGVAAIPSEDTVAVCAEGGYGVPPRQCVYRLQTPQGFLRAPLAEAYRKAIAEGKEFTDDSGLYAAYVAPPVLVLGDRCNKKLTYAEDFAPVECAGFGVDTHAFSHQDEIDRGIARLNLNYITLGGVTIPSDRALEAHSDGDVVVHALMDALLSAAGQRDIGFFFPDNDPNYVGANSIKLLAEVLKTINGCGFRVKNVSISVLAERPRLSPYIEEMRQNLRAALGCQNVAIAAGTNEKLGYIGEGRGITAYALALLCKDRS